MSIEGSLFRVGVFEFSAPNFEKNASVNTTDEIVTKCAHSIFFEEVSSSSSSQDLRITNDVTHSNLEGFTLSVAECSMGKSPSIKSSTLIVQERFERASLLLEKDPKVFVENVAQFTLEEGQLFELAKILIKMEPDLFVESDFCFHFKSREMVLELLCTGIVHHPLFMSDSSCNLFFIEKEGRTLKDHRDADFKKHSGLYCFLHPEKVLKEEGFKLEIPSYELFVQKISKERVREKLLLVRCLGYIEISKRLYHVSEMGECGRGLLEKIFDLRPPSLRCKVIKFLFCTLSEESSGAVLESKYLKEAFFKEHASLFQLFLSPLLSEGFNRSSLIDVIAILNFEYFADVNRRKIMTSGLLVLMENLFLSKEDKVRILKVAFKVDRFQEMLKEERILQQERENVPKESKKKAQNGFDLRSEQNNNNRKNLAESINKNIQLVESLVNMGYIEKLKEVNVFEDLEVALQGVFAEATGIGGVESFLEKYLRTFGSSRNPEAILIYAGKLKVLSPEEKIKVQAALKIYVESTLNGTLSDFRYQESPRDHLSTIFKSKKMRELKPLWMQGDQKNLTDFILSDEAAQPSQYDVYKRLKECVCMDAHISESEYPFLSVCLQDRSKLQETQMSLYEALKSEKNVESLNKLRVQKGLLNILEENKTTKQQGEIFDSSVARYINLVFPGQHQFKRDLEDLRKALHSEKQEGSFSVEGWSVVDTDDFQDMLLCGTEVPDSCQNVNAGAETNKCLLGYALDGKNRLVAVKNEKGEIVARSIMRILWNSNSKTPVLFKERVYARPNLDVRVLQALDQMFIKRSIALHLLLLTHEDFDKSNPCGSSISSLSSKAPFEYVDATRGITNGKFTIQSSSVVFYPSMQEDESSSEIVFV